MSRAHFLVLLSCCSLVLGFSQPDMSEDMATWPLLRNFSQLHAANESSMICNFLPFSYLDDWMLRPCNATCNKKWKQQLERWGPISWRTSRLRNPHSFIAANETLLEVLRSDWEEVSMLNSTHSDLGAHLNLIQNITAPIVLKNLTVIHGNGMNITYDASTLPGNTIKQYTPQRLFVEQSYTFCDFPSPFTNLWGGFTNETAKGREYEKLLKLNNQEYSGGYFTLENLDTKHKIKLIWPLLHWIPQWGFYMGNTAGRVSPTEIYHLLAGRKPPAKRFEPKDFCD